MRSFVIIWGPQASGKTLHAQALARHYGMRRVVDEFDIDPRVKPRQPDTLYLTSEPMRGAIHINDALREAGIPVVRP